MEDSLRNGFMAAFAVSGGVVFLAMHAHNRLLSNFIKKMELEINNSSDLGASEDVLKKKMVKKKVRFADDIMAESAVERAHEKKHRRRPAAAARRSDMEILEGMPQNWQVLYKGILHRRNLRGYN